MPNRPPTYRPPRTAPDPDTTRGTASQRGYGSRWQRFRLSYLADHPLCVKCLKLGLTVEATDVDHLDGEGPSGPRGYDETNLQALCGPCHSRKTVRQDGGLGHRPTPQPPQPT